MGIIYNYIVNFLAWIYKAITGLIKITIEGFADILEIICEILEDLHD